jgi:O-acetyl-ADP-ribose deacetylase (regulator of RNase III)
MKVIKSDLVELAKVGKFDIIIHGCNCFNTMGSGIARQIRDEFPNAYVADSKTIRGSLKKLGEMSIGFHIMKSGHNITIINAYTQFRYWREKGEENSCLVDYDAIEKVFKLIKTVFGNKEFKFGIPKIGAGLAGGDWERIKSIIDPLMKDEDLTLVEYQK